jgi:hypothetical protein
MNHEKCIARSIARGFALLYFLSCASILAEPFQSQKTEFSLGSAYGERKIIEFEVPVAGVIVLLGRASGDITIERISLREVITAK